MDAKYFRYYGVKVVSLLSMTAALILIFGMGHILIGIGAFLGGQFLSYLISGGRSLEQLKREYYYGGEDHF